MFYRGIQQGVKRTAAVNNILYEKYQGLCKVSGLNCLVKAEIQSGKILGKLSCPNSTKPFTFEFKPRPKPKINLAKEMQRLNFTKARDARGRMKFQLDVMTDEETVTNVERVRFDEQ